MQVPEGWKKKRISELGGSDRPAVKAGPFGSALKKEFYVDEGYKIYGQEQVISNDPFYGDYYIDEKRYKNLESCSVRPNDILMSLVGTLGRILIIPSNAEMGIINPRLLRLSLCDKQVNVYYIKYLLEDIRTQNLLERWSQGGTMGVLNASIVSDLPLLIPPLAEQEKIAEILSTWDHAIEQTERLKANAETHKQALMQQLLTGKKRFPEFEGEWKEYRLSKLGETFNGLSGKTAKDFGTGKPFITYKNIFDNSKIDITKFEYVNIEDNENQQKVERGDLFFTTSSETPEEVGMSSVMLDTPTKDLYLNSFCFGLRLFEANRLLPEFAQFLFRSNHVRQKIILLAQGSTRFNLSKIAFMKIKIKLPSIEEQQKIAAVLNRADREIELLAEKLDHLKTEKRALMQQLLTGKRRVKVDG
ncbi:MAG: hypothetical protein GX667_02770 [Xanthomonadaceae bacterium]|nr:hypothetical protein [Xanthomonadaceae bacterium]